MNEVYPRPQGHFDFFLSLFFFFLATLSSFLGAGFLCLQQAGGYFIHCSGLCCGAVGSEGFSSCSTGSVVAVHKLVLVNSSQTRIEPIYLHWQMGVP